MEPKTWPMPEFPAREKQRKKKDWRDEDDGDKRTRNS